MEQEMICPATADGRGPLFPFLGPYCSLSSPQLYHGSGDYSAISPIGTGSPLTPGSSISLEEEAEDPASTKNRLFLARLLLQYQNYADRYELCLAHLQEAAREAEALRLENQQLRIAKSELAKRLGSRISPSAAISIANELQRLRINTSPPAIGCPTSIHEPRVSLPKSISVRSKGYKKPNAEGGSDRNGGIRVSRPAMVKSVSFSLSRFVHFPPNYFLPASNFRE